MKKNKLENKGTRKFKFRSRLDAIDEIAVINELPFSKVVDIYIRFNYRVYGENVKKGNSSKSYNPILEEKVFNLTDRYFCLERVKKLKEYVGGVRDG
ncbi:MAG: hypothetical protein ABIE36_00590 [Candidatus Diapherotrites archaeon]